MKALIVLLSTLFTGTLLFAGQQATTAAPDYAAAGAKFINELAAKQFHEAETQFDQRVAQALPEEKLAAIWSRLQEQVGAFQKIAGASVVEAQGNHLVTVNCEFEHGALDALITFDANGRIAGLSFRPGHSTKTGSEWTPPDYAHASQFHEVQVTIEDGPWKLPGTLTLPNGTGPFPAAVLVSGSGPNDADETVGPDKPFKDLAWGLASRGIAVLRYPKRTRVYGAAFSADPKNPTVKDEYIDDADAAVALLAARPDVETSHIYLLGHSEGAYLAPRIAAGDPQIAGIAILAGNTRPLEQLTIEQLRYLLPLQGVDAATEQKMIQKAEDAEKEMKSPDLKPGTVIHDGFAAWPSSYVLDLRGNDPAKVAAQLFIPILVLQGARDFQVRLADFDGWKKALAGHANAAFKLYPGLTHLFTLSTTPGTGLSTPKDYQQPGHVAGEVVSDIAVWIEANTPKNP
jgi:dienelactone hydrolase